MCPWVLGVVHRVLGGGPQDTRGGPQGTRDGPQPPQPVDPVPPPRPHSVWCLVFGTSLVTVFIGYFQHPPANGPGFLAKYLMTTSWLLKTAVLKMTYRRKTVTK